MKRFGILIFLILFLLPMAAYPKTAAREELYSQVELLAEAMNVIQSDYVNEVEPKRLVYGALKGLVESLDRHSQFLDPNAFTEMQVETKGEFGGVGLEIAISKDGFLTIITPIDDTPAAGSLKPNDKIIKIDGQSTRGISLHEAVKRLRGRPGSKVNLNIFRESENRIFDISLTRALIKIQSVKDGRLVSDRIGYIRITEFQDNTPKDLKKALEDLEQKGIDGLILDLRNNPGGLLDVAVDVSEMFLSKGKKIVSTRGRVKSQNIEFISKSDHPERTYPIVILVNGGSASASEIVAGALRDHKRALLMGTKTFGKGSVQTVVPLRDGSAIRLTTSAYYTPLGYSINGEGLEPDVSVDESKGKESSDGKEIKQIFEEDNASLASDLLVKRAVDLLKGLKVYKGNS